MSESAPSVLYIDDDEGLRRLAERSLARRGFRIICAASGPEGLELAKADTFDLIAVDHYMPGQDGLATLAALRALQGCPPIVYVTGSEESRIAVAALKAGAIDYVVKTIGEDFFDLLATAFAGALEQVRLRSAQQAMEEELRASNERLHTLLREVNHRVSNSLQLVSAMVHMQANAVSDPAAKAALTDTQSRIQAIAQVHRRLYSADDVEFVAMDDYLAALIADLEQTSATSTSPCKLTLRAEPLRLATDRAVSLGTIVNELVTNACKYAYPPGEGGEVRIAFTRSGEGGFVLTVEDDGPGLPADGKVQGTGLGTRLVKAMTSSLGAKLSVDPAHRGVRVSVAAAC
jgi:two-component sensor histidine kinase